MESILSRAATATIYDQNCAGVRTLLANQPAFAAWRVSLPKSHHVGQVPGSTKRAILLHFDARRNSIENDAQFSSFNAVLRYRPISKFPERICSERAVRLLHGQQSARRA